MGTWSNGDEGKNRLLSSVKTAGLDTNKAGMVPYLTQRLAAAVDCPTAYHFPALVRGEKKSRRTSCVSGQGPFNDTSGIRRNCA